MGHNQLAEGFRNALDAGDGIPVGVFTHGAAPTNNVTQVGRARVGSLLIDIVNGKIYIATVATTSTVTWASVGSQA
jgi:hypothetical protein